MEMHKDYLAEIKQLKKDILTDDCIFRSLQNQILKNKSGLCDILNIEIARRAEMPIITSERKAHIWKSIYEKVLSQEETWKLFRKET